MDLARTADAIKGLFAHVTPTCCSFIPISNVAVAVIVVPLYMFITTIT
jgi:hypothetical protein